jgi:hypothetical protein
MTPTVLAKPSDVKSTIQWLVHLESSTNIWSYETLVIAEEYRLQPTSKSTGRSQLSCNPEYNPSTRSASTISEMYHNVSQRKCQSVEAQCAKTFRGHPQLSGQRLMNCRSENDSMLLTSSQLYCICHRPQIMPPFKAEKCLNSSITQ